MAALDTGPAGTQGVRWGMVVDLNRCVGCQTCAAACKHANGTVPGVQWRQVLDVELGTFPDVERFFLVVGCQHCAEPPCVPVCPTGATYQRPDGAVAIDYDLCIGCGYCAVACPYQARSIVHEPAPYYGNAGWTKQEALTLDRDRIGVAEKCTFCTDRVETGLAAGLKPGIDLEATPACAASCIAQAIHFGDLNDAASNVSRLMRENETFDLNAELGTKPGIHYLYETPAVPGRDAASDDGAWRADRDHPLVGQLQRFWDFRAAMNFTMGGLGSGLAVAACLAWLLGAVGHAALVALYLAAGVAIAAGLGFVFMEIGRKERFYYAILRPQSSWMSREVYAVGALYGLILLDLLMPAAALDLLIGIAAAAFLFCQARILHAGKGIPAWRVALMPWMLVLSGLFEGVAVLLAVIAVAPPGAALAPWLLGLGAALAIVNLVLWQAYRRGAADAGIGPFAQREIAALTPWLHGIGHVLPALCLAGALVAGTELARLLAVLAGVAAVAGGGLWKFTIITRAGHQQGFNLAKLPQRGSGKRAAPVRLGASPGH